MRAIYCLHLDRPSVTVSERWFDYASAWARIDPDHQGSATGSRRIGQLVDYLARDLSRGASIALGFSVPLFIPLAGDREALFRGRPGDTPRASAGVGACVGGIVGAHAAAFVLSRIAAPYSATHAFTCSAACWSAPVRPVLLAWEAFVSGPAKAESFNDRCLDAATAAAWFDAVHDDPRRRDGVQPGACLSLIGAVALRTGWTTDVSILAEPCVMVRPAERFKGRIVPAS